MSKKRKKEPHKGCMTVNGFRFVMTSVSCPEQYDVFLESEQVGYLRLRNGRLRGYCPNYGGEENLVYSKDLGDEWRGCFRNEEERVVHFIGMVGAIMGRLGKGRK